MGLTSRSEFMPKWIAWELTRQCNLDCVHCRCSSYMNAPAGNFTTEKAFAFLDDLAGFAKPVIVLSGGEPLLRDDLWTIANHGTDLGLRMCIATNGVLITDEVCEQMKSAQIRMVSLSLDGPNADVHDDFRRMPGAFTGTIYGAKLLKKHGIEFLVNSSFTRRNVAHAGATYRLAKELGVKAWYMFLIVPTGRGEDLVGELLAQPEYDEILNWHYEQEKLEHDILMRPTCAPHYYRLVRQWANQDESGFKQRDLTFSTGSGKGCVAGQTIALISAFGDVHPCSYMSLSAGNVFDKSFKEIWETSPLLLGLRDFESYKGRCGRCEFRNVCGGCRVRAFSATGDVFAEDPVCTWQPKARPR